MTDLKHATRKAAADARAEERGERWTAEFKKWFDSSEQAIARLEAKDGAKLKRRQAIKATVATMVNRIITLEDKKNNYKASYEDKRGKLHHAEGDVYSWRKRALEAEAELEKRGKPPEPKKAEYTRPGEPSLLVKLLGLFQFHDGNESGPVALIEMPDGKLEEVGPSYLRVIPEQTIKAVPEGRTGRFDDKRPGEWQTIEVREFPSRKKGFIEFGEITNDDDNFCLGLETGGSCTVVMVNEENLKVLYSRVARAMARIGGKRAIREADQEFIDVTKE